MAGGVLNDSPNSVISAIVEGAYTAIEAGNAELNGTCRFDKNEKKFVWPTGQSSESGKEVVASRSMNLATGRMSSSTAAEKIRTVTALPKGNEGDERDLTVKLVNSQVKQSVFQKVLATFQDYMGVEKLKAVGNQQKLKELTEFEGSGLGLIYSESVLDRYANSSSPLLMLEHMTWSRIL